MKVKEFFNLWLPVIVWCGVIFGLSSIPTLPTPKIYWWDFVLKKSAHVIEYAILYFLMYRAINKFKIPASALETPHRLIQPRSVRDASVGKQNSKFNWIVPFLFGFLYALSDEYHQKFVPGRHMKLMDIGFDILGMLISYLKLQAYG